MRPLANKTDTGTAGESLAKSAGFTPFSIQESLKKSEENSMGAELQKPHSDKCEKDVEVVVEDGVVRRIRVRCSCGEITEIDCRYAE